MIRKIVSVLAGIAAALTIYAICIAPTWLRVTRLRVALPGLKRDWQGVKIAHLSDFHVGAPCMSTDHLHKARHIALGFQPEIIALTGDFYDQGSGVSSEGLYADWHGDAFVFAVLGNHDRRGGAETLARIRQELEASGAVVLDNEARQFPLRGIPAWVAGVEDPHTFHADVEKAFAMVPDGEQALLLLSHAPSTIRNLPVGRAGVMLAGHTHGGQIRIMPSGRMPLVKLIRKLRGARERPDGPVYRGWHWMKGTVLVISDGLGVSTLPMRFLTRPHLILIELDRAEPCGDFDCDDVRRYVTELEPERWPISWLA